MLVVLGNAYLSSFFFAGQSPVTLKQCMVAYTKAVSEMYLPVAYRDFSTY